MADPLDASRFYACTTAGRMECPRCGFLIVWGAPLTHPERQYFDPVSSRIRCARCRRSYTLGVIAWDDVPQGPKHMPLDQQFSVRQLSELRQRAGGFWPRARRVKDGPTNLYVVEGCSCAPLPWSASCAVHGQSGIDHPDEEEPT